MPQNIVAIKHINTKHKRSTVYTCNVCGVNMADRSNFRVHCDRHVNKNKCACNICGQRFVARSNLLSHKALHTQAKKPYAGCCALRRCPDYKKHFKDLMSHVQSVHLMCSVEDYKKKIIDQYRDFQAGINRCECENNNVWICKYTGSRHSCYLCECSYIWDDPPTVLNGTLIWDRTCKYKLYSRSMLFKRAKINFDWNLN